MIKNYMRKEVVFRQGDIADCMYEVESGCVNIYVNYGESNEKLLTKLEAGATFGEMGLIDNLPRSATAVVMENDTQLQMVNADDFANYFANNPGKVLAIMKHMNGRIRTLTGDYLNACRAISEYEEAAEGKTKKSSWLKENFKKFMQDYADATVYLAQHPEAYYSAQAHEEHFLL